MNYSDLKVHLKSSGVSQREVVSRLISAGFYVEDERQSLKTRVNMALNGKRTSQQYEMLLKQIEFVACETKS